MTIKGLSDICLRAEPLFNLTGVIRVVCFLHGRELDTGSGDLICVVSK